MKTTINKYELHIAMEREHDTDGNEWINTTVTVNGKSYQAGGGWIEDGELVDYEGNEAGRDISELAQVLGETEQDTILAINEILPILSKWKATHKINGEQYMLNDNCFYSLQEWEACGCGDYTLGDEDDPEGVYFQGQPSDCKIEKLAPKCVYWAAHRDEGPIEKFCRETGVGR